MRNHNKVDASVESRPLMKLVTCIMLKKLKIRRVSRQIYFMNVRDMGRYGNVFSETSDALFILLHFFISLKYDFPLDAELKHEKCKKNICIYGSKK